ncbi:MAG: 4-hydroxy-tetrahydrodipicolinate reductase [Armatimonadetes bacterium]|nr:4-hydroxy-tetrahydrodipicolinate reductase [Armatimonadota bacterium]
MIKVAVVGCCGRMGSEVMRAVTKEPDMQISAAIDLVDCGQDAGVRAGLPPNGVLIEKDLEKALSEVKPDVLVDFTKATAAKESIAGALSKGVAAVVGTTGLSEQDLSQLGRIAEDSKTPLFIAPNFAIGAVLLMKFAKEAARHFSWAEIVELHHEKKLDAPSGTALRTAELLSQGRDNFEAPPSEDEKIPGVRGGNVGNIRIHSIRLPGLVAHQEVLFGGQGQVLSIRHDSMNRESFMPGVVLAIRKVRTLQGLVVGLEHLL